MSVVEIAQKLAIALDAKFADRAFTAEPANARYDRITSKPTRVEGAKPRAYAFVERATGKLFNAGGWAVPVTGARFDLSSDKELARVVGMADSYGSFLYKRR